MSAGSKLPERVEHEDMGQAAAAARNRQREARERIIQELERLGIPRKDWPSFVQRPSGPEYRQSVRLEPFQPPDFERLQESPPDWVKKANAAWKRYRDAQVLRFESWVTQGVDERIPEAKRSRGPGRKERNAAPDARYHWAARRLSGVAWKVIAIDAGVEEGRVRKAATKVLIIAGWPE